MESEFILGKYIELLFIKLLLLILAVHFYIISYFKKCSYWCDGIFFSYVFNDKYLLIEINNQNSLFSIDIVMKWSEWD